MKNITYETIVLSGGSIKGLAVLGALQYFYDRYDMKSVNTYIGTSVGSIICYLLAIGYKPNELMAHVISIQLFNKMCDIDPIAIWKGDGVFNFNTIGDELIKLTEKKGLDYSITLLELYQMYGKICVFSTYNYTKSRIEYLSYETNPNLPCLTAIRMSSNLPLLFSKFIYEGDEYIDGGIGDNFPIQLSNLLDKVLGIYIHKTNTNGTSFMEYIYNIIFIPIHQSIKYKVESFEKECTLVRIKCPSSYFNFQMTNSEQMELYSQGYEACRFKK